MSTLADLARWAADAPPGTLVPAEQLAELLEHLADTPAETATPATPWRVLLWSCDPETRLGRDELLEAVGRPPSWLYRHTGPAAEHRIPHRRMEGQLVFVAGEVRRWLREREEIEVGGPSDGPRLRVS